MPPLRLQTSSERLPFYVDLRSGFEPRNLCKCKDGAGQPRVLTTIATMDSNLAAFLTLEEIKPVLYCYKYSLHYVSIESE